MKSGIIAEVDGNSEKLNEIHTQTDVDHDEIDELERCISITDEIELNGGQVGQKGEAAVEDIVETSDVEIENGEISVYDQKKTIGTKYTKFLYVPDEFLVATSSSGRFVFPLIREYISGDVYPLNFDLDSFVSEKNEANPWKIGFQENIGNAENGVVHGSRLFNDSRVGDMLDKSEKNQIGLEYEVNGKSVKMFATRNGYAEIYQPSNFQSSEFAEYLENELLPHSIRE